MFKDETMDSAFKRLTHDELGLEFELSQAEFIGPFEHFYDDNIFYQNEVTDSNFTTHYIVLAYCLTVDNLTSLPQEQHDDYIWMNTKELLCHPMVHQYTRDYFNARD